MELLEGKMAGTKSPNNISTKLERIAQIARKYRGQALNPLAHFIDIEWLREAYRRTRKDGAVGVGYKRHPEFYVWAVRGGNSG